MYWFILGVLLAMVVLCIVGAFLGTDRAKGLFNSTPMCAFWGALAVLLVISLARRSIRRSPGRIAIHIGLLLILAGGIWGSEPTHNFLGRMMSSDPIEPTRGYLLLKPNSKDKGVSSTLWNFPSDGSLIQEGSLPFTVEARRCWLEYYPPEQGDWQVMGIVQDDVNGSKDITPLFGEVGSPALFPAIHGDVTVLGYNTTLRTVDLELKHNNDVSRVTVGPVHQPAILLLRDLFDTQEDWQDAGQPALTLIPPEQAVRDYKADLVLQNDAGQQITADVVEVNHPLHAEGYHIYLSNYDPELGLVLQAVSDDGLYCVYAGFALLMIGLILQLWIQPMVQAFSSRAVTQEAGDVG